MNYPVNIQTQDDLVRECLGCIWHAAVDLSRAAEEMNVSAVQVQYEFLKKQMNRLEIIRKNVRRV